MWFAGIILIYDATLSWCAKSLFFFKKYIQLQFSQCCFPFSTGSPQILIFAQSLPSEAPGGSFLSLFATQCAVMLFHLQPRSISSIRSEVWDLRDSTGKQRDLYDTSYCFRLSLILHKACSFEAWATSTHTHFQRFLKFTCIVEQLYCISFQVSFSLNSFGNGDGVGSPYTGTFLLSE